MAKFTPPSAAGTAIHNFFAPTPGDMYGNSAPGPSPALEFTGNEAGKQISETMQSIESVASAATQSLQSYRDGIKNIGESLEDFAENLPIIGESFKPGDQRFKDAKEMRHALSGNDREANSAIEMDENQQRDGNETVDRARAAQINDRYGPTESKAKSRCEQSVPDDENIAKSQLTGLDSSLVSSMTNNSSGTNLAHGNAPSSSDSALIAEMKATNQLLLQIKQSLGIQ